MGKKKVAKRTMKCWILLDKLARPICDASWSKTKKEAVGQCMHVDETVVRATIEYTS